MKADKQSLIGPSKAGYHNTKGGTALSDRERAIHQMKTNNIDLLFISGAHNNNNSKETHDDYEFYYSTSVTEQTKKAADNIRRYSKEQKLLRKAAKAKAKPKASSKAKPKPKAKSGTSDTPTLLSGIELFNLDADKLGMGVMISLKLNHMCLT